MSIFVSDCLPLALHVKQDDIATVRIYNDDGELLLQSPVREQDKATERYEYSPMRKQDDIATEPYVSDTDLDDSDWDELLQTPVREQDKATERYEYSPMRKQNDIVTERYVSDTDLNDSDWDELLVPFPWDSPASPFSPFSRSCKRTMEEDEFRAKRLKTATNLLF